MTALGWHVLQSTVFAAAMGGLAWTFRRERARTRHALWLAASLKFLVPFGLLVALSGRMAWRAAPEGPPPQMTIVMADWNRPTMPVRPAPAPSSAPRADWLPNLAAAVWIGGAMAFLIRWRRRWKAASAAASDAALAPEWTRRAGVPALVSRSIPEPCVVGIFRPVLLVPEGIGERLSLAQLDAVLAHELCHIRRRDNLWGAIHMVVECLFWFHPLVWWIGARLVEERELACDEEVLARGADPEVYAEGILKICELCCQSPLPCVSGMTGADLMGRIERIVAGGTAPAPRPARKTILAICALAAISGPLAFGLWRPADAQELKTAAPLRFDVASVKAVDQPWLQVYPERSGGRIRWTTDLRYIVEYAYRLSAWRISGPLPGSDHIYAFDVVTSPSATEDQVRLMFQTLLAERFRMSAHRITKDVEGYALTVARGGPKLMEARGADELPPLPEWFRYASSDMARMENRVVATIPQKGVGSLIGRRATMLQLADGLQKPLQTAVLDQTGLTGQYYFGFEYARDEQADDVGLPTLFTAIQRELGLRLEKHIGPVEMLVIDRIEKTPTEN